MKIWERIKTNNSCEVHCLKNQLLANAMETIIHWQIRNKLKIDAGCLITKMKAFLIGNQAHLSGLWIKKILETS
jgi:hypothetical protein